jgi:hypothetical protein
MTTLICAGVAVATAALTGVRNTCFLDRCVPVNTTRLEHVMPSFGSADCDAQCVKLGANEFIGSADDWVPRGDLMIAVPSATATLLRKSHLIDSDAEAKLPSHSTARATSGQVAKMQRKWQATDGGERLHVLEFPHPEMYGSGPGCNPTPPPTPPPPPPPHHCQENYCAGLDQQYPVSADTQVLYKSTYTVPAIPETFDPDAMTFYLYYNLIMDHHEDPIGKYNQFVPQLTLGGSFCNGTGAPEYLPAPSSLNPLKTWYIQVRRIAALPAWRWREVRPTCRVCVGW